MSKITKKLAEENRGGECSRGSEAFLVGATLSQSKRKSLTLTPGLFVYPGRVGCFVAEPTGEEEILFHGEGLCLLDRAATRLALIVRSAIFVNTYRRTTYQNYANYRIVAYDQ